MTCNQNWLISVFIFLFLGVDFGGDSGKSESSLEKGLVDRSDASDVDAKVDNMARCFRTNQRILVRKG